MTNKRKIVNYERRESVQGKEREEVRQQRKRKKSFERQRLSQLIHRDYKHYFGISLGINFFDDTDRTTSEYIWSILRTVD